MRCRFTFPNSRRFPFVRQTAHRCQPSESSRRGVTAAQNALACSIRGYSLIRVSASLLSRMGDSAGYRFLIAA